mgnify:CR=1 FL=1
MKKFKFSLESLIELRLREEREALHKLGLELEKQVQARKQWEAAVQATGSCRLKILTVINGDRISPGNLYNHKAFLQDLETVEESATCDYEAAKDSVKRSKEEYYRKKAETDILVKLREKSHADHMLKLEKIESMETDDLVLARHNRSQTPLS